ncbi:hypothetical protein TSUD_303410 [Trifolium subterraneum]|uniref:Uncharacterized protein n=1 Tax=Trifolium subterraneum TaxID=3900 RepID=A0A2Z6MAZ4_TRISU|nr:hypothetical protein TSUD_303410 [Trifolium subterraneum]
MQFTDGSSNIIKSQLLHLQDQNTDNNNNNNTAKENNIENEDEQQNGFLLQHMRPHGNSHILEIVEDGVFVRYEEESSCENHKGKLSVKKSKGKKSSSVKGKKLKGAAKNSAKSSDVSSKGHKKSYKGKQRGRKKKIDVHVNEEEGVDLAVKAACIEEVRVKEEIIDYAYDADDDDFKIMPVESPVITSDRLYSRSWHIGSRWIEIEIRQSNFDPTVTVNVGLTAGNPIWYFLGLDCMHSNHVLAVGTSVTIKSRWPYSKEEHENLLRDIKVQKPVQNYKDLRGRIKIYEEDRAGKSYLEHNLDLAKQIEAARDDPPKELCLLRGFFFWLSNSTLEGNFMPWRVPSCLDEWYHNNRKG